MAEQMKIEELPYWLQQELEHPVPQGGMNNHCMKIAPALFRAGMSRAEARAELVRTYPSEEFRIDRLLNRAEIYAQEERAEDPDYAKKRARYEKLRIGAQEALPRIIAEWPMPDVNALEINPDAQRRLFLNTMFDLEDVVWIGEPTQSGPTHSHHFRSVQTWLNLRGEIPGEFITHCTFKPGSVNRTTESIAERRYMVVESDQLSAGDLAAVSNYIRGYHRLPLRAIVTTGGCRRTPEPGLHFWHVYPGDDVIGDWSAVIQGYSCDPATLRGPQPCRLAGCIRQNTGLPQELWWVKPRKPNAL